ncbi:hypothetical protein SLU01_20860 [Sporosarcina luteola]|uniref:Uncharacterized protein n=1 Tax=Sporosarcina luteola TaxID=582850 RepID=A0A511Z8M5_9BACL|nr:hypothetical protein SLU01_20860 [Sporosarcina luteola]
MYSLYSFDVSLALRITIVDIKSLFGAKFVYSIDKPGIELNSPKKTFDNFVNKVNNKEKECW